MGGGIGRLYSYHISSSQFTHHLNEYSHYYNSLHLCQDDLFRLYLLFLQLDHLKNGWITYHDLIKYLKLSDTKFIYKVFHLFDSHLLSSSPVPPSATSAGLSSSSDHNPRPPSSSASSSASASSCASSKIYFYQFVLSVWSICTLYQKDYILYLYNLYDLDETGFLDTKLSQQIIEDIYGDNFLSDLDAQRAYEQLGTIPMKSIDPYTFQRYGGSNPRILFQIFTIQSCIRKGFGGEEFWEEQSMKRAQLNPGIHVSVHSLLGHSRRGKLRSTSRSYAYQTSSSAGAHQSSEDFKMPRQLETEASSVKAQLSQPLFLHSFNENRDYFDTPDILEMETLP